MPIFIEFGTADTKQPVEQGTAEASQTLASGATSNAAASEGFVTVTPDENGYIDISNTPNSAIDPRRRVLLGVTRSFAIERGQKVMFTAG